MKEIKIPHFAEQMLVARGLVASAKNSSESMETLIHWLLGGFGAGLVYLFGQVGKSSTLLETATIKAVGILYLYAVVLGIVQRVLAMLIKTAATAFQEAEKLPANQAPVDLARYFLIYIETVPVSSRWLIAAVARRFVRGHLTDTGRGLMYLAILQSTLGSVAVLLLLRGLCSGYCWPPLSRVAE